MKASEYILNLDDFDDKATLAANALNREIAKHIREGKEVALIGDPELIFDKENMQYFIRQKYQTKRVEDESE